MERGGHPAENRNSEYVSRRGDSTVYTVYVNVDNGFCCHYLSRLATSLPSPLDATQVKCQTLHLTRALYTCTHELLAY